MSQMNGKFDIFQGEQLVGYIAAFDQDVGDPNAIRYMIIMPELGMYQDRFSYLFFHGSYTKN